MAFKIKKKKKEKPLGISKKNSWMQKKRQERVKTTKHVFKEK